MEQRRRELQDFRLKMPILVYRTGPGERNIYAERLARIEARRSELLIKTAELQVDLGVADQVLKGDAAGLGANQAEAAKGLILLLQRGGLDLAALAKKADQGDAAKTPNDVELLKSYRDSLLAELQSNKLRLQAFEAQFDREQKDALEVASFEAKEQMVKDQYEQAKALYDVALQRAQEMKLSKALGK